MNTDSRNVREGWLIPTSSYSDQPYVVKTDDGAWLCVVTTGAGHEGEPGQHVTSMRSVDRGKTWSKPVPVEPAGGPEASYAVMLKVPGGRVYCFYNHNTDNLREVKMENGKTSSRVDTLGYYVFKYSDDHGNSWSDQRYVIPVREFECDRNNTYGGAVRFFWNVGRPVIHRGAALLTLHKVGAFGEGFLAQSEGVFLRSENMLTERDPAQIIFETLPDGDVGLRAPEGGGRVAEEQCVTVLSDGTLFCVYRTVAGWPVSVRSFDGGRSWTRPLYMRYVPGSGVGGLFRKEPNPLRQRRCARLSGMVKHPRAATFVWRCANGKYLYWFHNHGGRVFRGDGTSDMPKADPYEGRNPVWLAGGVERDATDGSGGKTIEWSEPEVLLYDDDTMIRMSYPDMVEEDGSYYFTETQKCFARTHEVDTALIEGLWRQLESPGAALPEGALVAMVSASPGTAELAVPALPWFYERDYSRVDYGTRRLRNGFTIALEVNVEPGARGEIILLDTMTDDGRGLRLCTDPGKQRVTLTLSDGRSVSQWSSDHWSVLAGKFCRIGVIVDGGPGLIMFVIDGALSDGGDDRQFGWGRLHPLMQHCNGAQTLRVTPDGGAVVESLRIYGRALRVSELVVVGQRQRMQ